MSDNNNALIIGAAILGYLYLKNNQGRTVAGQPRPGVVKSMPGNVGAGWQQVGVGAVAGFLQSVIGGVRNNTSQVVFPSQNDPMDAVRGDQLQEGSYDDSLIGDGSEFAEWA
jgi:hypothetical protein